MDLNELYDVIQLPELIVTVLLAGQRNDADVTGFEFGKRQRREALFGVSVWRHAFDRFAHHAS